MEQRPDCSFVICVEKGSLEYKALLLILTLRKNWGVWSSLPIYAYSPRAGKEPSGWLQAVYDQYNVRPVYEQLNIEYADYPQANKPIVMAHAERTLTSKFLVFLDTDILCWREPKYFALPDQYDLSLCVEGTKTASSSGPEDPYDQMWKRLYELAGATSEPYVVTHLTSQRVRSWWLSSVVPSRRACGLMNRWLDVFKRALREDLFVPEAHYFRDQMTLSAVAVGMYERFLELPISHNYPIQSYDYYSGKGASPDLAILWHYQPFLNKFFRSFAAQIDASTSLTEKISIAESAIAALRRNYPSMIGQDETFLQKWRRELRLGPRLRRALGVPKPGDKQAMWGGTQPGESDE
jgi:hypothetical protein